MQPNQVRELATALHLDGLRPGASDRPLEVRAGRGLAELWRLPRRPGPDALLRVFPVGSAPRHAEREAAGQRLAIAHGVRAPAVLGCAVVEGRPVLAMEWIDAPTVSRALTEGGDPHQIGRRCGSRLAALHGIAATEVASIAPVITERDWIDWAGARAERLRGPIGSASHPEDRGDLTDRRLLHLDFHPDNLLLDGDDIVVLDWANTRVGPIAADLARSATILQLVEHHPDLGDVGRDVIAGYRAGFSEGYRETSGIDPDTAVPPAIRAWAAAVGLEDLAGADWVPDSVLAAYRECYREGSLL